MDPFFVPPGTRILSGASGRAATFNTSSAFSEMVMEQKKFAEPVPPDLADDRSAILAILSVTVPPSAQAGITSSTA